MKTTRQLFKTMLFLLLLSGIAGCSKDSDSSKGGGVDPVPQDNTGVTVTNKATDAWGLTDDIDMTSVETLVDMAMKFENLKLQTFKVLSNNWEGDLLCGMGSKSDPTRLFEVIREIGMKIETYNTALNDLGDVFDKTTTTRGLPSDMFDIGFDVIDYFDKKSDELYTILYKDTPNKEAREELYSLLPNEVKKGTSNADEWFSNFNSGEYGWYANDIRNAWYEAGMSEENIYARKFFDNVNNAYGYTNPIEQNVYQVGKIGVTAATKLELSTLDMITGSVGVGTYADKFIDAADIFEESARLYDKIQKGTATTSDLKAFAAVMGSKYVKEYMNETLDGGTTVEEAMGYVTQMVINAGVSEAQKEAAKDLGINIMEILDNMKSQVGYMCAIVRDPKSGKTTIGLSGKDGNVRMVVQNAKDGKVNVTIVKGDGRNTQVIDANGGVTSFNALPDGKTATLKATPSTLTFYNWKGETKSVKIRSNYKQLNFKPDVEWCKVAVFDDEGYLWLEATPNDTGKKRTGTITVTGNSYYYDDAEGGKDYTSTATIRVEQYEQQDIQLTAKPDKYELTSNAQNSSFTITSNLPYVDASSGDDWIELSRDGKTKTFNVHFKTNSGEPRKGKIILKGSYDKNFKSTEKTAEIPVSQESEAAGNIRVTPKSLEFKAEGGMDEITFYTAGYPYYGKDVADDAKDWLTVQFGAGYEDESDKLVGIFVSKNTTSVARPGIVTFWVSDEENPTESQKKKVTLTVKQEAAAVPTIKVDPDHLDFEASGGTQTLTVTTNQPYWGGSKKGSWFTVTTNGNKITVTADPNPTSDTREGSMTLYARNENKENVSEPVVVPIKQKGATSAAAIYKWVKFVNVEFKVTAHKKSNDHSPEDWIDTWSSPIPSSISRHYMEENGLKVDVSDSGSLVKITKTLEFDRYDNNHWIYKAEIYIDPVKKLITSLYVYEKFWLSTDNGDQPQVLTLRAENIPLEKEKSGTGTKAKGTILNELSSNGQSGWVVFDYKWEGADDYQIKVTLSE